MAGDAPVPLTTEQAKQRLREVARDAGISGWTRRHPYHAVLVAMMAGLAAGGARRFDDRLAQTLLAALLGVSRLR
ncbi:MAG TPA: hypothetical protein ENK12_07670 [Gammaproteobacteria bacterium]|nr:hypothetical protein [Gammaproteobacteria bacterium]